MAVTVLRNDSLSNANETNNYLDVLRGSYYLLGSAMVECSSRVRGVAGSNPDRDDKLCPMENRIQPALVIDGAQLMTLSDEQLALESNKITSRSLITLVTHSIFEEKDRRLTSI